MYSRRCATWFKKGKILTQFFSIQVEKTFLFQTHSTQREHEMLKKKCAKELEISRRPKFGEMEAEKREEGLQKSLDSTNKGFALLAKMGYKAGESLGKEKTGR